MATKTTAGRGKTPEDPIRELKQLIKDRKALERREAALVRRARNAGYVWEDIANALGVSKQAVHKKYGGSRLRSR